MKKIIAVITAGMLVLGTATISASAHGHRSRGTAYSMCTIEGCSINGTHKHGNTYYKGHCDTYGYSHHSGGRHH